MTSRTTSLHWALFFLASLQLTSCASNTSTEICKGTDEICTTTDDCCAGTCLDYGRGVNRCACHPQGNFCAKNDDCCSKNCYYGKCDCVSFGRIAREKSDCCSGFSHGVAGYCWCHGEGFVCENDAACCSGVCYKGRSGSTKPTGTCKSRSATTCTDDASCSSGFCKDGKCCKTQGGCFTSSDCCTGDCINGACRYVSDPNETCSYKGECFLGGCNGKCCYPNAYSLEELNAYYCNSDAQCCSGICDSTKRLCSCIPNGQKGLVSEYCCSKNLNADGFCSCASSGQKCQLGQTGGCCNGSCGWNGKCP